jgi:hypothetical protein
MKSKTMRLFLWTLLTTALCLCATACLIGIHGNWPVLWVDEGHPGPRHAYYYYPDAEVYYDPGPSLYYWHENDRWRSDNRLPDRIVIGREKRVRFESDAEKPYIMHDRVIERYHSRENIPPPPPRPDDEGRR